MTQEEFLRRAEQNNKNVTVVGKYVNMHTHIKCICNHCGKEYYADPQTVMRGAKCKECTSKTTGEKNSHSQEYIKDTLASLHPNIELLDILPHKPKEKRRVRCRCKIDGHEWMPLLHHLLEGHGCPKCASSSNAIPKDVFLSKLSEIHPNIVLVGDYVNCSTKTTFRCLIDDFVWEAVPTYMINDKRNGCPICGGTHLLDPEQFLQTAAKIHPNIEFLDKYTNSRTRIHCRCKLDGYEWMALPSSLIYHYCGCPKCSMTRGENRIDTILQDNNIIYEIQKRFSDCRDEHPLPFDFYIPSINMCIEFDGEQHFRPVRFHSNMTDEHINDKFQKVRQHDLIKDNYCKDNQIELLRIPYYSFDDIDTIISERVIPKYNLANKGRKGESC